MLKPNTNAHSRHDANTHTHPLTLSSPSLPLPLPLSLPSHRCQDIDASIRKLRKTIEVLQKVPCMIGFMTKLQDDLDCIENDLPDEENLKDTTPCCHTPTHIKTWMVSDLPPASFAALRRHRRHTNPASCCSTAFRAPPRLLNVTSCSSRGCSTSCARTTKN